MADNILVLTASDRTRASHFSDQLHRREKLGLLRDVTHWRVIADPDGRRVGSGGSTIHVLAELAREGMHPQALGDGRLLIIHAGGESRRMPAHTACGKVFAPIPGGPRSSLPYTLLDAQLATYLELPSRSGGQVIMCSGDVLLRFDPAAVDLSRPGLTGVASPQPAQEGIAHGVYARVCDDGKVGRFLQKPSQQQMDACGAMGPLRRCLVDLGIMSFTPQFANRLLGLVGPETDTGPAALDFYTEIACALGTETTFEQYAEAVQAHGPSGLRGEQLETMWRSLRGQEFHCSTVEKCDFLHFGTTADYLRSAERLSYEDSAAMARERARAVTFCCGSGGPDVEGADAVVEGCEGAGEVVLGGRNVVTGALVTDRIELEPGVCLDVLPGRDEDGGACFFYRLYGIGDTFKGTLAQGTSTFLGAPLQEWVERCGVDPQDVWPQLDPGERSLWNARLFPAAETRGQTELVLWMQHGQPPDRWLRSRRYSMEEMSALGDADGYWRVRLRIHSAAIRDGLPHSIDHPHELDAVDLAEVLCGIDQAQSISRILSYAQSAQPLSRARLLHTLGSAVGRDDLKAEAFAALRHALEASVEALPGLPRCAVKRDQIVWGRSPVRLDLAGGWTDTPPYSLERGGTVVNVAVDLNGQPPVQVFARVSDEPHIKLNSIDLGLTEVVTDLEALLDFRSPAASFSIPKAALAFCGFSPQFCAEARDKTLQQMLERFGGGIELTLLCALPKGSGLGTSSILGATLIAALARLCGTTLTPAQVFHRVLVLEQVLTTGGGWQDQIGGVLGGMKCVSTRPGLVPDPLVHWLPHDLFRPAEESGGALVLYYTGITRLARNILQRVVGRYMDRDRETLRVLDGLKQEAGRMREAVARRDLKAFGQTIARTWELNKRLEPGSTNEQIEDLMQRVMPHAFGAKLLGAGGGGFLLAVCRDPNHAARLRADLESKPQNELARFFAVGVNAAGLEVTVS